MGTVILGIIIVAFIAASLWNERKPRRGGAFDQSDSPSNLTRVDDDRPI